MAVPLPQELYDAVIDCLQGDKQAIEACSLTCDGWTLHARRCFDKEVCLQTLHKSILLLHALELSARPGSKIGEFVLDLMLPPNALDDPRIQYAASAGVLQYTPNIERFTMLHFDRSAVEPAAFLGPLGYPGPANQPARGRPRSTKTCSFPDFPTSLDITPSLGQDI